MRTLGAEGFLGRAKPPAGSRVNFSHYLGRSVGACFLFNEGSGKRIYDAAYGYHYAITGTPKFTSLQNEPGLYLTQSDTQYVDIGNPTHINFSSADSYSVELILVSATTASSAMCPISKDTVTGNQRFNFYSDGSNLYRWTELAGPALGSSKARHHLLYTYDGRGTNTGLETWYENGRSYSSRSGAMPSPQLSANWNLGRNIFSGSNFFLFNGLLSLARIYRRALSAADAVRLWHNPYEMMVRPGKEFPRLTPVIYADSWQPLQSLPVPAKINVVSY